MSKSWMIRAGEEGQIIDAFSRGFVAIGWSDLGDLSNASNRDAIRGLYLREYPGTKPGKSFGAIAMIFKFRSVIRHGDKVVSYDPRNREYLVGTVASDYLYNPAAQARCVRRENRCWDGCWDG